VVTVQAEDDVVEVIDAMLEHKIGALPVVAADSSLVVGIVSYLDVLRAARRAFA
jgi:CBS domain-containing protein